MIATLITLILSFAGAPAMDSDPAPTNLSDYCAPITWESSNQGEWDALLGMGWTGHADDQMEALYAPGC